MTSHDVQVSALMMVAVLGMITPMKVVLLWVVALVKEVLLRVVTALELERVGDNRGNGNQGKDETGGAHCAKC